MSVEVYTPDSAIRLTPAAIQHMIAEIEKSEGASAVRIAVKPSGCSGYMYEMELVAAAEDDDVELHPSDNLSVFIAKDSIPLLQGTELDFVKQGLNAVLQFKNPNATAECGCGESFSVTAR